MTRRIAAARADDRSDKEAEVWGDQGNMHNWNAALNTWGSFAAGRHAGGLWLIRLLQHNHSQHVGSGISDNANEREHHRANANDCQFDRCIIPNGQ